MDDHWLAIRRLGPQWVNVNSMLKRPELLTDTYLAIYLQTMQAEGMHINDKHHPSILFKSY